MLKSTHINAVVFFVANLEHTLDFYGQSLGLVTRRVASHEGEYGLAELTGSVLVFFENPEANPGKTPIVVFGVEKDIEQVAAELARRGVEFVVPVSTAPSGGLTADFLDPDAHVLSLYQAPDSPRLD